MKAVIVLFLAVFSIANVEAKTMHFILSKDTALYNNVYKKILNSVTPTDSALITEKHMINSFSKNDIEQDDIEQDDIVITIGNIAAEKVSKLHLSVPIINSFVTNQLATELEKANKNSVYIVLNQPFNLIFDIATTLVEDSFKKKIVVVVSTENTSLLEQVTALNIANIDLVTINKNELAAKKIETHLFNAGALVAINDKMIWSGHSAKLILQQAFTHKVPVIGYSKNFLKAGALVSAYSTLDSIADNTALLINNYLKNTHLSHQGLYFPNAVIEINPSIARTLRIPETKIKRLESVK